MTRPMTAHLATTLAGMTRAERAEFVALVRAADFQEPMIVKIMNALCSEIVAAELSELETFEALERSLVDDATDDTDPL